MTKGTVLATGGAGYIGTHVSAALMEAGYRVVILDDLSNASVKAVSRLNELGHGTASFVEGDVRQAALLDRIFTEQPITGVVHLAGLKAVGESMAEPASYYDVNLGAAITLARAMIRHRVPSLVFSSSATVYAEAGSEPLDERAALGPTNPYGRSKLMIEQIFSDVAAAEPWMRLISLRYFNPVGAHPSGQIGEDPRGVPNNLFPFIAQTATGQRDELRIFGRDWPTPDGTGVRDYIHVMDLAAGHVAALDHLLEGGGEPKRNLTINLGTGRGTSVLEAVQAFEAASGRSIPYRFVDRRPGDIAICFADPSLANRLLGWRARRDLSEMCRDHWAWQSANPTGYD